jgi:Xaa-Pro aminopeptidase
MRPESPGAILTQAQCPAFLVTDLVNIRYLTGMDVSAGSLLVLPRRMVLFLDARYKNAMRRLPRDVEIADASELPLAFARVRECGFESEDVSVFRRSSWKNKFPKTSFVHTAGILQSFRRSKDVRELESLREAERRTRAILKRIPKVLKRGITEEKLARTIQCWALDDGADGVSFPPIVAFGSNTGIPHHRPTDRPLSSGDLVQIDIGVRYRGYCADLSEVFFTAEPTRLQRRMVDALNHVCDEVTRQAVPGASVRSLDRLAKDLLSEEGVEEFFTHALGHGVGLEVHEGVTLSERAPDAALLPGEVITVEPGVYFPGRFGLRLERMVYVGGNRGRKR